MLDLWLLQAFNNASNNLIWPKRNDWLACLSVYLLELTTHCAWPESSTRQCSPTAKASELVMCFGAVTLKKGLSFFGILAGFSKSLTLALRNAFISRINKLLCLALSQCQMIFILLYRIELWKELLYQRNNRHIYKAIYIFIYIYIYIYICKVIGGLVELCQTARPPVLWDVRSNMSRMNTGISISKRASV